MAVLRPTKIYHFLAEPKTICKTAKVCSFVKMLYVEVLCSIFVHQFLPETKMIHRTAKVSSFVKLSVKLPRFAVLTVVKTAQV